MILLVAVSCNKKSKSDSVVSGSAAYVGKTYTLCSSDTTNSTFIEIRFLDSENISWKITYYSNTDCLDADKTTSDLITGKYRYNASTGIYGELLLKDEMTFHDQDLIDNIQNDSSQNCGFNDWEINVAQDITGSLTCYGGSFEAYTEYDEVPGASFKADVVTLDGISYYP